MKLNAIAKEKEKLETKDAIQISTTNAKNLTDSTDFFRKNFFLNIIKHIYNFNSCGIKV